MQPGLEWKRTGSRPKDEGGAPWEPQRPSPHTWGGHGRRESEGRGASGLETGGRSGGAGRTVTSCRGPSRVPGGKRYVRSGKPRTSCCSTRPLSSAVSSGDWLRMRTNLPRRLTATIFRQEPVGLGQERERAGKGCEWTLGPRLCQSC